MKADIILAGVGGQGILSIATVLAQAAIHEGLSIKQSEVHGMSQRGGDVQANLRISSSVIYSDLIPRGKADLILSLEPMEALRYLPYLSADGLVVSHNQPFVNITPYPALSDLYAAFEKLPSSVLFDAEEVAKQEASSARAANMVLLGAASKRIGLQQVSIEQAIHQVFNRKGEKVVDSNIQAFRAGLERAL